VKSRIQFSASEMDLLDIATAFYTRERYPVIHLQLPPRQQIKDVLDFAEHLLDKVCGLLEINKQDVMK